jgi:hypothetical protein
MKGKRFELVQATNAKTKDSDYPCAEIVNAMPLLQHENAECGPIAGGGMQVLVESTPKEQALQQDEAIAAKAAEHERRAVAARKAWVTIRSKKAAAEVANQATELANATGTASGVLVATGPTRRGEQIPPSSFAQSSDSDNAGKLFRDRTPGKRGDDHGRVRADSRSDSGH